MYETQVTISGRLVADPEPRTTKGGQVFTTFRLATSERRRTKEGTFEDGPTSFYNVAAYRTLGVNVRESLHKGEAVVVVGRQRVRQYQRADETYGTSVEVEALHVGHDLVWGQTTLTRPGREDAGDPWAAEAARQSYEDGVAALEMVEDRDEGPGHLQGAPDRSSGDGSSDAVGSEAGLARTA